MNFHLYLVLPQNIPEGERFYLVTARYCLLYTTGPKPQGAKEITKISTLPHLAKEWLAGCIDRVREQALEEQKDRLLTETGPAFYAAFEQALRAERERQATGNRQQATGDGGTDSSPPLRSAQNDGDTDSSAPAGASAQNDGDGGEWIATARSGPRNDKKEEKEDGEA